MFIVKHASIVKNPFVRTIGLSLLPSRYLRPHPSFGAVTASRFRNRQTSSNTRQSSTIPPLNMASDEDYMSFLDKANEDPSKGVAKSQSQGLAKAQFKTTDQGVEIPAALKEVTKDAFYVSDADEPFVPVALNWDEAGKGLPDEGESHHSDSRLDRSESSC
jgi:hypothetical protein